ncbi:hypothetical protein [Marinobacterium jannaschii]|uniref:hypothetical protein n=1 Tax=Marinobacterium jannaschii TaxID=64970 RepID=UPI0004818F07|nr:hypothetical protein [Marinobacterium jannaschii]
MTDISKKTKKILNELASQAYEKDLSRCLDVVYKHFQAWKAGEIEVWDVNQAVHDYHDGIARELYKTYCMNDPLFSVVFGVHQGLISIDDVPEEVRIDVERMASSIKK